MNIDISQLIGRVCFRQVWIAPQHSLTHSCPMHLGHYVFMQDLIDVLGTVKAVSLRECVQRLHKCNRGKPPQFGFVGCHGSGCRCEFRPDKGPVVGDKFLPSGDAPRFSDYGKAHQLVLGDSVVGFPLRDRGGLDPSKFRHRGGATKFFNEFDCVHACSLALTKRLRQVYLKIIV